MIFWKNYQLFMLRIIAKKFSSIMLKKNIVNMFRILIRTTIKQIDKIKYMKIINFKSLLGI